MKQMISKRVRIGMRAAMMLAVVMMMMFATTTEALAQTKYKITTDGNCEVYYYDNFERIVVTEAEAGKELSIWLKEDANPASGYYFTQEYTLNGTSLGSSGQVPYITYNEGFTMPAKDVTIAAKQAKRETISFDLTTTTPQEMPSRAALQFSGDTRMWTLYNDELGGYDVNNSGVADMTYYDVNGEHNYVQRLAGADATGTYTLTYPDNRAMYGSISFIFPEKKKIQVQSSWITLSGTEFTYTGQAIEPTVTVMDGNTPVAVTLKYNNNENVGTASVTVTANAEGYTGSATKTFTIAPKPVTISGVKANDKVYDGTATADIDAGSATFDGKVDGDVLTVDAKSVTAEFSDAEAGKDKPVTLSGSFSLAGTSAGNYTLSAQPQSATGTIAPKPVTVESGLTVSSTTLNEITEYSVDATNVKIVGAVNNEKLSIRGVIARLQNGSTDECDLDYTAATIVIGVDKANNYVVAEQGNQSTAPITASTETVIGDDGSTTETTQETVTGADGSKTETTTTTVTCADGTTTETTQETVTGADGSTTETTTETVRDAVGNVIETTETIKEKVTNPDGTKTTTETIKETVTDKDGKETTTETIKETVTDKDGKVLQTTEAITTTATGADGSQTITTSKTPETDANEIYSITADGKVTKINGGASSTPAIILNGIMSLDATENNNLITYPTLGSVDIETQPSILIAQGDEKNVLFNTTTEKNAQGQTTATSASMTVKETGGADGTGDTGPTKIAINTGGGDNGGGNSRYIITWQEDGTVILSETYAYFEMPIPPKPDPTKDDDDDYTYTFKGWTPSISPVTGNANYTAVFEATPKTGGDNGGGTGDDNAGDAPTSGKFVNLTWEVSKSDANSTVYDVLTISGSGKMEDGSPWSDYKKQIKTVILESVISEEDNMEGEPIIISENVFAGYTGDHVYVTVPKGKILSVILNMGKVWTDPKSREIIRPTDGKVDIIDYLFANPSERTSNRELPIVVDEIYPHLKVGDTFTLASENIEISNTVSIPYKCYHDKNKNGKGLFGKAEMKALGINVESLPDDYQVGMTVDATLTAELVTGTNDTYRVTENKATKLTFKTIPANIANEDTFFNRPENISFEGADIDIENIYSKGVNLAIGDRINLVVPFGDKVGSINGSRSEDGKYNYHAFLNGSSEDSDLIFEIDSRYEEQEPSTQDLKGQAATTMIVQYEIKKETGGADVNPGDNVHSGDGVHPGAVDISGGKSKVTANKKSLGMKGGTVNRIIGGGTRAATAEPENDEIEIVSGREYEILHDGYVVLNFYTPDGSITVNSIIIRRPGDANNDGYLNAADLVEMVNAKNDKASERFNLTNADINLDGIITHDDIDFVVKLIMEQMDEE